MYTARNTSHWSSLTFFCAKSHKLARYTRLGQSPFVRCFPVRGASPFPGSFLEKKKKGKEKGKKTLTLEPSASAAQAAFLNLGDTRLVRYRNVPMMPTNCVAVVVDYWGVSYVWRLAHTQQPAIGRRLSQVFFIVHTTCNERAFSFGAICMSVSVTHKMQWMCFFDAVRRRDVSMASTVRRSSSTGRCAYGDRWMQLVTDRHMLLQISFYNGQVKAIHSRKNRKWRYPALVRIGYLRYLPLKTLSKG
jgi:hypothetical protein